MEARLLLSVEPVSVRGASQFGPSGDGNSRLRGEALSISGDGQLVVFESDANDLVPNDFNRASNNTNPLTDVFLFNRATGRLSLVSVNAAGTASGNGTSRNAKISRDGRYVLFESDATNLTADGAGGLFLRDLQTGVTTLVSKSTAGVAGNGISSNGSISADGRYVAFQSSANNLVAGDANGRTDIFLRDLVAGTTTLVSHKLGDPATGGNNESFDPRISDDGRVVAYTSFASDLVSNDGTNVEDIFVWRRQANANELISVDSAEVNQSNAHNALSRGRAVSADGRYVLFETNATNLVPQNGAFEGANVYLRDRQLGTTVAVTLSANGSLATGGAAATMTADGRFVAFVSGESDLVAGLSDTNGAADVFLRDMSAGTTELISRNAAGTGAGNRASGTAQYPFDFSPGSLVLSDDGRYVAFASEASNLVAGTSDANDARTEAFGTHRRDVFVRDRQAGKTVLVSRNLAGTATGNNGSFTPAMSADGKVVAFESLAGDLVARADGLGLLDVFVRDVVAGHTDLASRRSPLLPDFRLLTAGSQLTSATPDGRFVVFDSGGQVFVRDRVAGTTEEASVRPDGTGGAGRGGLISADGRFVVFNSGADLASEGPAGSGNQIYVRDRQTGKTRLVSVTPTGQAAQGSEWFSDLAFSRDGRYVAWSTSAQDLVTGFVDGNGGNFTFGRQDVFIRDLRTGVTRLVSHVPGSTAQSGNGVSWLPVFSADGGKLIFISVASNLVSGVTDANGGTDLFAYDVATGQVELVSANAAGTGTGNFSSGQEGGGGLDRQAVVVSADGRYVAFTSDANNLTAGDSGGARDVYVRDLLADTTTLVSVNAAGTGSGNSSSSGPSISADGRYVAFSSFASDLVAGDTNAQGDVFVRDLVTGVTTRVSVNAAGGQSSGGAGGVVISPDGKRVSFFSDAADLVANFADGNGGQADLYVRDLTTGVTDLVSVNDSGTASGNAVAGTGPWFFTDGGTTVFFTGPPSDLVAGDRNSDNDVFAYTFAGAGQIRGTLFADADRDGVKDASEAGLRYWTVYLDANGNGRFDAGERSVRADLNGNYAFTGLAAGTYTVGIVLPDGFVRTAPAVPGTFSMTLAGATSVVSGKNFGAAVAPVDLEVASVAGPQAVAAGRDFVVSWLVRNLGGAAAAGDWQDAVYLSRDAVLDATDVLVGVKAHTGGLADLSSYTASLAVAGRGDLQGSFYVIVQTDRRRQVVGDVNRADDVAAGPTLTISVPRLTVGAPFADAFTGPNQDRYYSFTVTPGQSLVLTLDSAGAGGAAELYLRRGALPTPWEFDRVSRTAGKPDQKILVPVTQAGTYYVLARGLSGGAAVSAFTVTAALPGLKIEQVSKNVGGNTGKVTVKIEGSGFTRTTTASLTKVGTAVGATFVDFRSASLIYATFDLTGNPAGTYNVRVADGPRSDVAAGAFQVVEGGRGHLDVRLSVSEAVRASSGVTFSGEYDARPKILVEYENDGTADVEAPLFNLTTDIGELDIQSHTIIDGNGGLLFLGTTADGPSGVLRPGAKGKIEARLTLPLLIVSSGTATITLTGTGTSTFSTGDGSDPKGISISWSERKAAARPDYVSSDAWDPIWANFSTEVGTTTADFQRLLSDNATYLGRLGETDTTDLNNLIGFELQQADATLPVPILSAATDAAFPTPGLDLEFGRVFLQPISGRHRLGILGRGWASNWEVAAVTDANGNVRIDAAGGHRFFSKLRNGTYLSAPGDSGVLTRAGGVYSLREADGSVTAFRPNGKVDFVRDSHGTRITAGYDAQGRLVTLKHSTGPQLTIAYNAQGRIASVTDPAGRVTTYGYDASGEHLVQVTSAAGTTRYTYFTGLGAAREHALAGVTNPDGTHQFFTYDARGRLAGQSLDGGAEAVTYAYGSAGEVSVTDATGARTLLLFDEGGRVRQVRDALGRRSDFGYDAAGGLVAYVSPTGLQWTYDRDARGNVVRTLDPLGRELRMTYDAAFNGLTSLTDAKGHTTRYAYDAKGDLRGITYPNGSKETFEYDPLGNLSELVNRRGHAIGYEYDARGLLTKKTFADGSHADYTYDAHGNLKTAADAAGTVALDYDAADRLTKVTYPGGRFLEFTYDAGGRRTKSVDQDGYTVNYAYDAAGRLFRLTDGGGATVVEYAYDSVGRLSRKDLGNGTFATYEYDAAGQLMKLVNHAPGGAVNSSFEYGYDAEGRRTSVTTAGGTTEYEYDALGQLTQVSLPGGRTIEYAYDAAGNRVSVTDGGVTTQYVVNDLNQYVRVGATTFTYDADGNLVGKNDGTSFTAYTFDDENRLLGSVGPDGAWAYDYDPLGNLAATTHDGTRTRYLVDPTGLGDVVAEYGPGGLIAHYTHGLGLVSRTPSAGSSAYYDFDATGNTAGLTNAAGAYVNRYSYLPFGETTVIASAVANPFTFVGAFGVMGAGGGLDYMRARFYDAATGQFISDDPTGLLGGDTNLRRYVGNAPTQIVDPTGLAPISYADLVRNLEDVIAQQTQQLNDSIRRAQEAGQINESEARAIRNLRDIIETNKEILKHHREFEAVERAAARAANSPAGRALAKALSGGAGSGMGRLAGALGAAGGFIAPLLAIAPLLPQANDAARKVGEDWANSQAGRDFWNSREGLTLLAFIKWFSAFDPNEIEGPAGAGPGHSVDPEQPLPYTIRFENAASAGATAPAQEVTVTHRLDADLDWSTVELDSFGFGDFVFDVPDGLQSYGTRVAYHNQDGSALFVDVEVTLDLATGLLKWVFRSVDPRTGLLPEGVFDGFLPVNDSSRRGEGFVRYRVKAKAGRPTGTKLDQKASIVFDTNAPIETNVHSNAIDAGPPASGVRALPAVTYSATPSFLVSWAGADDAGGSGVATYDVYVSENGGAFTRWRQGTPLTSARYRGKYGSTYAFYSVATDAVGHRELPPNRQDATTRLLSPSTDLIGYAAGEWYVGRSTNAAFETARWASWADTSWTALLQADADGDGRTDVIGLLGGQWYVGRSTGAAFATSRWAAWSNAAWKDALAADLNGDGRADVLARTGGQWWAALSTGTGFAAPKLWASWSNAAWDRFSAEDLTGDGKADLLGMIDGAWYAGVSDGSRFGAPALWAKWRDAAWQALGTADLDGDGRRDIYGLLGGAWFEGRSTGAAFATGLRSAMSPAAWKDAVAADFDGDGRDDLAARAAGQWWVSLSNASGGQRSLSYFGSWSDAAWKDVRAADFDGDGKADLAGRLAGRWYVARSTGAAFATTDWGGWADVGWRAVAAADAATNPAPAARASGGAPLQAAPGGTAAASRPLASRLPEPDVAPVTNADDPLALFWSAAERDEAFADRLLAGA